MNYKKNIAVSLNPVPSAGTTTKKTSSFKGQSLDQMTDLVDAGRYERAMKMIGPNEQNPMFRNVVGVILMRTGRFTEAVNLYRSVVLASGNTWTRDDLPVEFKINFATALLLAGHPDGCHDILVEVKDKQHPAVQQLNSEITKWENALPFWKKIDWKWFGIVPSGFPVTFSATPGLFPQRLVERVRSTDEPHVTHPHSPLAA